MKRLFYYIRTFPRRNIYFFQRPIEIIGGAGCFLQGAILSIDQEDLFVVKNTRIHKGIFITKVKRCVPPYHIHCQKNNSIQEVEANDLKTYL